MRRGTVILLAVILLAPLSAWAGFRPQTQAAPVLGDAGLIALGIGLLGAGVAFLRRP